MLAKFKRALAALMVWLGGAQSAHADIVAKPYTFVAGTPLQAAQLNADFDTIYNNYNGNITNANIKANAAISLSKIAFTSALGPILRAATNECIGVGTTGDTNSRWAAWTDGSNRWGSGSGSADVYLLRSGSQILDVRKATGSGGTVNFATLRAQNLQGWYETANSAPAVELRADLSGVFTNGVFFSNGVSTSLSLSPGGTDALVVTSGAGTATYRDFKCRDMYVDRNLAVTGTTTLSTPLTVANINSAAARKTIVIPIVNGTITDGATYTLTCAPMRAGTVTAIKASIGTAIVGGTNTLSITKNGGNTLLNAATVDPTTFVANTATGLTLTSTGADLAFTANDIIKIVHTAGTQGTDGVGESVSIEYATTDF
jgi:hypothetical protein